MFCVSSDSICQADHAKDYIVRQVIRKGSVGRHHRTLVNETLILEANGTRVTVRLKPHPVTADRKLQPGDRIRLSVGSGSQASADEIVVITA